MNVACSAPPARGRSLCALAAAAALLALMCGPALALTQVSSCGTLSTPNETYQLSANLTASGTCLTVSVSGITIDGQNRTITWSTGANGDAIVWNAEGAGEIKNVVFTKGAYVLGGGEMAHAIRIRAETNGLKVHDCTFHLSHSSAASATSVQGIFSTSSGGSNNEFYKLTGDASGDSGQHGSTRFIRIEDFGSNNKVHDCNFTLTNQAQLNANRPACIDLVGGSGWKVYNNTCTHGANIGVGTQGIQTWEVTNSEIYNNTVTSRGSGVRLINLDGGGSGNRAHHNVLTAEANPDPDEMVIGIRFRYGQNNSEADNNTLHFEDCDGDCNAFYFGSDSGELNNHHNRVHNNDVHVGAGRAFYFFGTMNDERVYLNKITLTDPGGKAYTFRPIQDSAITNVSISHDEILNPGGVAKVIRIGPETYNVGRGHVFCATLRDGNKLSWAADVEPAGNNSANFTFKDAPCVDGDGGVPGLTDPGTSDPPQTPQNLHRTDTR